ncbi:hypothetical protein [[Eubacterium] cellulosolvens]
MSKKKVIGVFGLIVIVLAASLAYLSLREYWDGRPEEKLKLTHIFVGVGVDEDNPHLQTISYLIYLYNARAETIYIEWAKPIFHSEVEARLLAAESRIIIKQNVLQDSYIEIEGKAPFSAQGLTRTQIEGWGYLILGVQVSYIREGARVEEVLLAPSMMVTDRLNLIYREFLIEDPEGERMAIQINPFQTDAVVALTEIAKTGERIWVGGEVEEFDNELGFRFKPDTIVIAKAPTEELQASKLKFIKEDFEHWKEVGVVYVLGKVIEIIKE